MNLFEETLNTEMKVLVIQFAKFRSAIYLFVMTLWIPLACSSVVILFCTYLLQTSGVWREIFAPTQVRPEETFDPLVRAPSGWIENHVFWDLHSEQNEEETPLSVDFWERESKLTAS